MDTSKHRKLLAGGAAAALVLGAGAVAGAAVGAGPFERDDSGADSPSDTTDVSTPATAPDDARGGVDGTRTEDTQLVDIPVGGTETLDAGGAGLVTVTRDADGTLRVVAVTPAPGWTFEVEPGDEPGEAEVDFRNGVGRVQLDVELEDGVVRVRVRTRGVVPNPTDATLPPGSLPRIDSSGPGSLNSGPGSSSSGPGPGPSTDDRGDSSGPGSGGSGVDDHGGSGSSGPGSGGGTDDSGVDDHGGSGSSGHGGDD